MASSAKPLASQHERQVTEKTQTKGLTRKQKIAAILCVIALIAVIGALIGGTVAFFVLVPQQIALSVLFGGFLLLMIFGPCCLYVLKGG